MGLAGDVSSTTQPGGSRARCPRGSTLQHPEIGQRQTPVCWEPRQRLTGDPPVYWGASNAAIGHPQQGRSHTAPAPRRCHLRQSHWHLVWVLGGQRCPHGHVPSRSSGMQWEVPTQTWCFLPFSTHFSKTITNTDFQQKPPFLGNNFSEAPSLERVEPAPGVALETPGLPITVRTEIFNCKFRNCSGCGAVFHGKRVTRKTSINSSTFTYSRHFAPVPT